MASGIVKIILLLFGKGFHVLWANHLYGMAKFFELSLPIECPSTRFDSNRACFNPGEYSREFIASQAFLEDDISRFGKPAQLKDILCQINSEVLKSRHEIASVV